MSADTILNWMDGLGWLVLSSEPTVDAEVRAMALSRGKAEGGVAYIGLDIDDAEEVMDDMADLGAPTGYFVNILTEDDETIRTQLVEASVIVITGDFTAEELLGALKGAALEGLKSAYELGAVILAESVAATLFGTITSLYPGKAVPGLGWLEDAIVVTDIDSIAQSTEARAVLETHTAGIAVGIGAESALVLGPAGVIESWGQKTVTIALGGSINEKID